MKLPKDVEAEAFKHCAAHFKCCGWPELDFAQPDLAAVEARMAALLLRASASRSGYAASVTCECANLTCSNPRCYRVQRQNPTCCPLSIANTFESLSF